MREASNIAWTVYGILFDMDGTLVDSSLVVERLWSKWCARHRLPLNDVLRIAHGMRDADVVSQIAPWLSVDDEVTWIHDQELSETEGLAHEKLGGFTHPKFSLQIAKRWAETVG